MREPPSSARTLAAILAAAVIAILAFIAAINGGDPSAPPPSPAPTVTPGPSGPTGPVASVVANPPGPDIIVDPAGPSVGDVTIDANTSRGANEQDAGDQPRDEGVLVHEDMRDETPPGVTAAEDQRVDRLAQQIGDGLSPQAVGGAQGITCARQPVVNQSALSSARVGTALHITVSDPGSMNAIQSLFNTPAFAASSNYGFDPQGSYCEQWVDPARKAWCQGAFNSAYICIEIMSRLRPTDSWIPILRDGHLASLVRDLQASIGSPLKLVNPVGCTPVAGITDHDRLECGNDHVDVGNDQSNPASPTAFPWAYFMRQVALGVKVDINKRDRGDCQAVTRYRHRRHRGTPEQKRATWKNKNERRQQTRVRRLHDRQLYCASDGAVKRKQ